MSRNDEGAPGPGPHTDSTTSTIDSVRIPQRYDSEAVHEAALARARREFPGARLVCEELDWNDYWARSPWAEEQESCDVAVATASMDRAITKFKKAVRPVVGSGPDRPPGQFISLGISGQDDFRKSPELVAA